MHSNNQYYLRAITAEKELAMVMDKGRALYEENRRLTRDHIYALKVIEDMGSIMQTRRHRFASALGRVFRAHEMVPETLAAMLLGIRTALAGVPVPTSAPSAEPGQTAPASEPSPDPAPQPSRLTVVGDRDA